jgi:hypothetical protein
MVIKPEFNMGHNISPFWGEEITLTETVIIIVIAVIASLIIDGM